MTCSTIIRVTVPANPATIVVQIPGLQGPPGPAGSGGGGSSSTFETINKVGLTLVDGQAVATHSTGAGVVLANSSNASLVCIGLVETGGANLASCTIQTEGPFELADWTPIIGSTSLAAKTVYYLDVTSGKLTATAPSTVGQIVQRIGVAIDAQTLNIQIWNYIRL